MPHTRRRILSNQLYELSFRAKEGLPVTARCYMKLILKSVLARACEVHPVELVTHLWMGNHPHILLIAKDSEQCHRFYGYIQKQITEAVKRLTRQRKLELWSGRPQVAHICDIDKAIERLGYIFNNPTNASICDTIERFHGLNSWAELIEAEPDTEHSVSEECPWVRMPMIEKLPSFSMSDVQDRFYTENLKKKAKTSHTLTLHPLGWIKVFCPGADPDFIQECIQGVVELVRKGEKRSRQKRSGEGRKVLGSKLLTQSILVGHTPKKHSRLVYLMASDNKERVRLIEEFEEFCSQCRQAYLAWKRGDYSVVWPPGAFRSSMPPTMNVW